MSTDGSEARGARRRIGQHEVARIAGVGRASVSRVLSGHPDVSETMRSRVLAAIQELGYESNIVAQSLRRGRTLSIGFNMMDISNPVLAAIVQGAEEVLRGAGYSLVVTSSQNDPRRDCDNLRIFKQRRVDGLLLSVASERNKALTDMVAELDVPAVLIDRQLPARAAASAVYSDHRAGVLRAVSHLVELGHSQIGLVSGEPDTWPGYERVAGLREAVAVHGLPKRSASYVTGPYTHEHGRVGTHALLDRANPPTALLVASSHHLSGCLQALQERGLRPGRDLALVSCDDGPLARLYDPPIAAITRDSQELGQTAAEMLLRRLASNGRGKPETIALPTTFVPRPSCELPRAGGPRRSMVC